MLMCMKRLSLEVTPEFERDLLLYMKQKGITSQSVAIGHALHEAVATHLPKDYDFRPWLGIGLTAPLRDKRRFRSEDDL